MAQQLFLGEVECLELWHMVVGNSSCAQSTSDVITAFQDCVLAPPAWNGLSEVLHIVLTTYGVWPSLVFSTLHLAGESS